MVVRSGFLPSDFSVTRARLRCFRWRNSVLGVLFPIMEPTLQNFPALTLVGIGGNFISVLSPERNNHLIIPPLWEEFCQRQGEIAGQSADAHSVGCVICPTDIDPSGRPGECRYIACAEVTVPPAALPEGMEVRVVPAGRYAVFVHRGPIERLGETLRYVYETWLPHSGEQSRDAPELEFYGEKFHPTAEDSEMTFCLPIQ